MSRSNINTLIISAGYSRRMGKFKPLLLHQKLPFILQVMIKTAAISDRVYIVTGYRTDHLRKTLDSLLSKNPEHDWLEINQISTDTWSNLARMIEFIDHPDFQLGMFTSLQQGLKYMKIATWTLYHFVDQPHLPPSFYHEFSRQLSPEMQWIQPRYKNKNGHPILFHKSIGDIILAADITKNLNTLFKQIPIKKKIWDCQYPEVLQDFDTPSEMLQEES